ncbi:MAG: hypothetical protein HYV20_07680 [Gemmatimonadetes bacterium]|nr:hypothetical protein [Gemmatimonadota bacterium]
MKADAGEHVQASLPSLWAGRNEERKDKREHFEQEALSQTGSLYRYATWLVRDRALAEDVVQETLLKAWCSWHTYRPGSDIRAWLATILRHTFIRQRRKEQRELASIPFYDVERFSNGCGDPRTHRAAASHEDALDGELMRGPAPQIQAGRRAQAPQTAVGQGHLTGHWNANRDRQVALVSGACAAAEPPVPLRRRGGFPPGPTGAGSRD